MDFTVPYDTQFRRNLNVNVERKINGMLQNRFWSLTYKAYKT